LNGFLIFNFSFFFTAHTGRVKDVAYLGIFTEAQVKIKKISKNKNVFTSHVGRLEDVAHVGIFTKPPEV